MKGRGPRPKPDAAREFDQRLHDRFQWIDGYAEVSGWWRDADLIASLGGAVAGLAEEEDVEVVLAPQSRGTLLGAQGRGRPGRHGPMAQGADTPRLPSPQSRAGDPR